MDLDRNLRGHATTPMNQRNRDRLDDQETARMPSPAAVRTQLQVILSSATFAQSRRQQAFLRFVVEETLAGRADGLKEYSIALDVFDRDDSFDPQTNSIVRVEASRLRGKLRKYYATTGRDDPVEIAIPTGTYVPTFAPTGRDERPRSPENDADITPGPKASASPARWIALAAFVAVAVAGAFLVPEFLSGEPETRAPAAREDGRYSIAVLPLRNLSNEEGQEFLSDGLTDALITSLAQRKELHVISLTSVMAYKNLNRPIAEIARELKVDHIVEGSVLRSRNRVRITAQLIEAATDRHLWAESYERDLSDVITMQGEVSRRIVASLSGKVTGLSTDASDETKSVAPEAQEAYLKGLYFRNQMTEQGFEKGIAYFKMAIEREPEFARAYSGLATCFCLLGGHGFEIVEPGESMPVARNAVLEAMRLDQRLAEPHAFMGVIRLKFDWDWPGAEASFKRSIELNPNYPLARIFYSFYLEAMGRPEAAIREAEVARSLDPLSLQANTNLGWQYLRAGRREDARRQFEATRELAPNFWGVHWGLGHYHRRKGAFAEAIESFQGAIDLGGGHALPIADLGYVYAIAGKRAEALDVLAELEAMAEKGYVSPYTMATIHVGLGEFDAAFTRLEEAYRKRSRSLVWLNVAEEYDGLRSDPRFQALLKRIGLPR